MARLLAGAVLGAPTAEPEELVALGTLREDTGVDDQASAVLRFPGGLVAELSCGMAVTQECDVRVYGTEGMLLVPTPWHPDLLRPPEISLVRGGTLGQPRDERALEVEHVEGLYAAEARAFAQAVQDGAPPWPLPTLADSLGTAALLDRWRAAVGLRDPADEAPPPGGGMPDPVPATA